MTTTNRPIRRALVSVFHKEGIEVLAEAFIKAGTEVVSTGSTAKRLAELGVKVTEVSEVTGFPECLDGRVKTLDPHIHAGILADMTNPDHASQLEKFGIKPFDLVVVNLYPFADTVRSGADEAATIEKLVQKGFLERKGTKKTKVLLPTDKGKALITVMPEEIQSPEMTADWETKLLQIERGEMEPETFMTEIKEMISSLVTTTEAAKGANALMKNKIIGVCPNCGANVVEREKGWFCENRECRFVLWKDNAFFKRLGKRLDAHAADKLLRDGRVRLKDCKSAKGKTYNATVLLGTEPDGRSKFSLEFEGGC